MSDSLQTIVNSIGAVLAACGWMFSTWIPVILAAAMMGVTVLLQYTSHHVTEATGVMAGQRGGLIP